MSEINRRYRQLPPIVLHILLHYEAWLVGSGADWYHGVKDEVPKDFDVMVPPDKFQDTMELIRIDGADLHLNSFGGLSFLTEAGDSIDLFSLSLDKYITVNNKVGHKAAVRLRPYAYVSW